MRTAPGVVLQNLWLDHELIEREQHSPFMTDMERYYVEHSAGFRGKIMMATWIPQGWRKHMIRHVNAILVQRSRPRRVARKLIFRQFVSDPVAKRFQTRLFSYEKTKREGQIVKRSKQTGRFVKMSQEEHRQLQEVRKHGK